MKRVLSVLLSIAVLFGSFTLPDFMSVTAHAETEYPTVDSEGYCYGYGYGTCPGALTYIDTKCNYSAQGTPTAYADYVCKVCGYTYRTDETSDQFNAYMKATQGGMYEPSEEYTADLVYEHTNPLTSTGHGTKGITFTLCENNILVDAHLEATHKYYIVDEYKDECDFGCGFVYNPSIPACNACGQRFTAGSYIHACVTNREGCGGPKPGTWVDHGTISANGTCSVHNTSLLHYVTTDESSPIEVYTIERVAQLGEDTIHPSFPICAVCGKVVTGKHKVQSTSTITASNTTKTYGDATFSPFTYEGPTPTYTSSNTAVATISTAGIVTIKGAGTTTLTATIAETSEWTAASKSITLTVNKKATTVTGVSATAITYGQTLASSTISGTKSVDGKLTWKVSSTKPSVADSNKTAYAYIFTPTDSANYNTYSGTVKLTVNKAKPNVTKDPTRLTITYGQTLKSSTFSGGTATPAGSWAWDSPDTVPTAGTTTHNATYTPTDTANYESLTKALTVTVDKATPKVTANPTAAAITYGATVGSSSLSGGSASVAGKFEWENTTAKPAAGTHTYTVKFVPTDSANYETVPGISISLKVNKATPTVTGLSATAITYGQTLGNSTVSATNKSTEGTLKFTSASTKPSVSDSNKTSYTVTFTPSDTGNYKSLTNLSCKVTVNKATPSMAGVTASAATATYETRLSNIAITTPTTCNGVEGVWTWKTSSTIPEVGTNSYPAVFTPIDTTNYKTATLDTPVTVSKKTHTPQSLTAAPILYETKLSGAQITGSCPIPGTYSWDNPNTVPTVADSNITEYTVTFTPNDLTHYNVVTGLKCKVSVSKLTPDVTAAMLSSITHPTLTYGQTLSEAPLTGTTPRPGTYIWVDPSYVPMVGGAAQPIKFVPSDLSNYEEVGGFTLTPNVIKATPTIDMSTVTATQIVYEQSLADSTITGTASVPGSFSWINPATKPSVADSNNTKYAVRFTPDDTVNYNTVDINVTIPVIKATPVINDADISGTDITFLQSLSSSTLSGHTPVTGSLTWEDPSIKPYVADSGSTKYNVTFTPDDTANYNIVTGIQVAIIVHKATPTVVTAPTASGLIYEDRLSDSTISGEMSVPGTWTWSNGTICPQVSDSDVTPYDVIFTPDDTDNYNVVSDLTAKVHVDKMTPVFTQEMLDSIYATDITYLDSLSNSTITGNTYVPGTFTWIDGSVKPSVPDSDVTEYPILFIPDDTFNYNNVEGLTCTLIVHKYTQTIDASTITTTTIHYTQTLNDSTLGGTTPIPGHYEWKDPDTAPTVPDSNSTSYEVIFYPDDQVNYNNTEGLLVKLEVIKADITFTDEELASIRSTEITFLQTLADSRIDSITIVPGHFVWADTTISPYVADSDTTEYDIIFKPDDYINYNENTQHKTTVRVNKAVPVVDEGSIFASFITYGDTLADSYLSGTAPVSGKFDWVNPTTKPVVMDSAVTRFQVRFTPTDLDNYLPNDQLWTTLMVERAQSVITTQDISMAYTEKPFTIPAASNNGESSIFFSVPANENLTVTEDGVVTMNKIGTQYITLEVPQTDNYYGTTTTIKFEITPAIANLDGTTQWYVFEYTEDFQLDASTTIVGAPITYKSLDNVVDVTTDGLVHINKVGTGMVNIHLDGTGTNYQSADLYATIYVRPDCNKDGVPDTGLDITGDGIPDLNVDLDGDFYPDTNIDLNQDLTPDVSVDKDRDGIPEVQIDTNRDNIPDTDVDIDGDMIPDISLDTDGDGVRDLDIDTDFDHKPDINVDTDSDGTPDINIDLNGDENADINIDLDKDGTSDLNIDTDNDNKPDVNIDTNADDVPNVNVDTDGDLDPDVNVDVDGDGYPDTNISLTPDFEPSINIDGDKDGVPELNIDVDGDLTADIQIDTNHDNLPDLNLDMDGDEYPDVNIDTDGDYKPDVNIDLDGDFIPDINIDDDDDLVPDRNIDTDDDGERDLNIDVNNDGEPDISVDTDGDGKADLNVDVNKDERSDVNTDIDGDGKPDVNLDTDGDLKPDINVDIDRDGKSDLNTDLDGDGKPDTDIDVDGDKTPDVNIDLDNDGDPDVNIDLDGDGEIDINKDTDGDDKPDVNIDSDDDDKPDVNVDTDDDDKPDINWDRDNDGEPDVNIDTDDDGKPDVNIDNNGDGEPDVNIDVDGDNDPDINEDVDADGTPDINIDTDGDLDADINIDDNGDLSPDRNIDDDVDNKPDRNIDVNDDGTPDINIDDNNDNILDRNIDTDGDNKPDVNIDDNMDGESDRNIDDNSDGKPDRNVDTDKDGKPDVNIDTDNDGDADINIDNDGDNKPDVNIDVDSDNDPDVNVDTDDDGKPDINKDTDGDNKPDVDIDTDGDNEPDVNEDIDGDNEPDINVDTDGDNKPDVDIDLDNDDKPDINKDIDGDDKPDINIDDDGDNKPDSNIDTDGDDKPDINIDNGDDSLDTNVDIDGDNKPDINIDVDGDGIPDINIDLNGDGVPDICLDLDGDLKVDLNNDLDGDLKCDTNIDTDSDGVADVNIDADENGKVDVAEVNVAGEMTKNVTDGAFAIEATPVVEDNILVYSSLNDVLSVTDDGEVSINKVGTGEILIKSIPASGTFSVMRRMFSNGRAINVLQYDTVEGKIVTVEVTKVEPTVKNASASDISIEVGKTYTLKDGVQSEGTRTYSSSNEAVATVSANGTVTAVSKGTAVITVDVGEDDEHLAKTVTFNVTVEKSSSSGGDGGNSGGGGDSGNSGGGGSSYTPPDDNESSKSEDDEEILLEEIPDAELLKIEDSIWPEDDESVKYEEEVAVDESTDTTTPEDTQKPTEPEDTQEPESPSYDDEEVKFEDETHKDTNDDFDEIVAYEEEEEVSKPEQGEDNDDPIIIDDEENSETPEDTESDNSSNDQPATLPPSESTEDKKEDEEDANAGNGAGETHNPDTGIHQQFAGTILAAAMSLILTIKRRKKD